MEKRKKHGVSVHLTLSKYASDKLNAIAEEMHIPKSAVITLALELFAKERGLQEQKKEEREKA